MLEDKGADKRDAASGEQLHAGQANTIDLRVAVDDDDVRGIAERAGKRQPVAHVDVPKTVGNAQEVHANHRDGDGDEDHGMGLLAGEDTVDRDHDHVDGRDKAAATGDGSALRVRADAELLQEGRSTQDDAAEHAGNNQRLARIAKALGDAARCNRGFVMAVALAHGDDAGEEQRADEVAREVEREGVNVCGSRRLGGKGGTPQHGSDEQQNRSGRLQVTFSLVDRIEHAAKEQR